MSGRLGPEVLDNGIAHLLKAHKWHIDSPWPQHTLLALIKLHVAFRENKEESNTGFV